MSSKFSYLYLIFQNAQMVESVDTKDLKSFGHCGRAGSTPAPGTMKNKNVVSQL